MCAKCDSEGPSANEAPILYKHLSPPASMKRFACSCHKYSHISQSICQRLLRLRAHVDDVSCLLLNCPDVVKIIVGPAGNQIELCCHKAILGFYSEFFDAAFYNSFSEKDKGVIALPEEDPEAIKTFIAWAYTGRIESTLCIEAIWALGERLQIPKLCNEAMYMMFFVYGEVYWLTAYSADLVYTQTSGSSLLRKFIKDLIHTDGPLCPRAVKGELAMDPKGGYENDWCDLIMRGGELVLDVARRSSWVVDVQNIRNDLAPYKMKNKHLYLVDVKTRPIEDFVAGKLRGS